MSNRIVKLCDFGLAIDHDINRHTASRYEHSIAGTLGYMAPEVLSGRQYNYKSDIYSLYLIGEELFGIDFQSLNFQSEYSAGHSTVDCKRVCGESPDCYHEYYQIVQTETYYPWPTNVTGADQTVHVFEFTAPSLPMQTYRQNPALSLTEYLCLVSGIFSLWFGFSLLFVSDLCVSSMVTLYRKYNQQ
ncbi:unnamed protein product, partial [Medioppia subpectinata]